MSPPGNLTHSEDASGGRCCTSAPQFGTLMVFCGSHRAPFGSHWSSSHVKTPDYLNWNLSILSNFCPLQFYADLKNKKCTQNFAIHFSLLVLGKASSLLASVLSWPGMATWYVMFQEAGWLYNHFSALINLREYAGKMCHFLLLAPWQLCDHGQSS